MMEKQTRRKYDAEFKRQPVQLSMKEGRTVVSVAEGLGPHISMAKAFEGERGFSLSRKWEAIVYSGTGAYQAA